MKRKFYISKINIHANIFNQNLNDLINVHIPRVILNPEEIKIHTWNWSFTDVRTYEIEENSLIIGNVTKSKFKKQTYKVGTKTVEKMTENELAETAFFVYNPKSELLVHQSNASISADDFRNLFTILLSRDPYIGEVIINPIPIPYKIVDELKTFDTVTKVSFHLIHPNPGKDEFNLYNEIIHETRLKELDIDMRNKDGVEVFDSESRNGDNINEFIGAGINLVEKGYGEIDLQGFNETIVQGKRKPKVHKKHKRFNSGNSVQSIVTTEKEESKLLQRLFNFMKNALNKNN